VQSMNAAACRARARWAPLLVFALSGSVSASNGLNLIGFGTESAMMGGADVAVARDTTALNTNPAGLSRLRGVALDTYSAGAYAIDVGHSDALGNDVGVSNRFIPLGVVAMRVR
jgi:long-chain fatty acid transport protein